MSGGDDICQLLKHREIYISKVKVGITRAIFLEV